MSDASSPGDLTTTPPAAPPYDAPAPSPYGQPAPQYGQPSAAPAWPAYGASVPPAYGAPPQPYGQAPAYGQTPGYGGQPYTQAPAYASAYGVAPKTNPLAIVSLIASIAAFVILPVIGSIVGIVTGHMSLSQLKTSGEGGRGLALAGTIVGWLSLAFSIFLLLLALAIWIPVISSIGYA